MQFNLAPGALWISVAVALAGCGAGGGGGVGGTDVTPNPLTLTESISTFSNQSPVLGITGGSGAYTVFSDNALVTPGLISSGKLKLTIGCTDSAAPIIATVTAVDSVGSSATSSITVNDNPGETCPNANVPLSITPNVIDLREDESANAMLTIKGGALGAGSSYSIFSSKAAIRPGPVSAEGKSTLTIGCIDEDTSAVITVVDDAGASATATVNVTDDGLSANCNPNTSTLSLQPSILQVQGNQSNVNLTVSGGTPIYSLYSNNSLISPAAVVSGKSALTIGCTDSTTPVNAIITVLDSNGASATSSIDIYDSDSVNACSGATAALTLLPAAIELQECVSGVKFTLQGGTPPFDVRTSDPRITIDDVDNLDRTFNLGTSVQSGPNAAYTVTVLDANSLTATARISVPNNTFSTPACP